jgi:hypothetical protein
MAERESSVVVSLNELFKLDEQRRREIAEQEAARARAEEARRLAAEQAERDRVAAEEQRQRESALRIQVETAQIDAAKRLQIEKQRLEMLVRMQADEIAARDAHARELRALLDARKPSRTGAIVATVFALLAAVIAVGAIAAATRKHEPPPPVIVRAPPDTTELDRTREEIAKLKKEILDLKSAPPPPAPTVIATPKPTFKPKDSPPSGTKCPPGLKGVPMCP